MRYPWRSLMKSVKFESLSTFTDLEVVAEVVNCREIHRDILSSEIWDASGLENHGRIETKKLLCLLRRLILVLVVRQKREHSFNLLYIYTHNINLSILFIKIKNKKYKNSMI